MMSLSLRLTLHLSPNNNSTGSNGTLTYIGTRGDEFAYRHLRPHHELGRAKFSYSSSRDKQSMADIIADADIVINNSVL